MAVHDLAETMTHIAETIGAGVLAGAISHWLEQEPTKPTRWRRGPTTEPASRVRVRAADGDVAEEQTRRAI